MTAATLTITGLSVEFGALAALTDVEIEVVPGHIHSVIGPNGAGKSTIFNAISGIVRVASGRIELDGDDITGLPPHRIVGRRVGRSFQNLGAGGDDTVLESLLTGRHSLLRNGAVTTGLGMPWVRRDERLHRARAVEIARFVGIADDLHRSLRTLPYGRQKLADIARAVCMEPSLLLLDEPAAGLDTAESREITSLIRDLREALDLTVLLIEHDMGLVMSISDRITVLDFGRRIGHGAPQDIAADQTVIDAYLGTTITEVAS